MRIDYEYSAATVKDTTSLEFILNDMAISGWTLDGIMHGGTAIRQYYTVVWRRPRREKK